LLEVKTKTETVRHDEATQLLLGVELEEFNVAGVLRYGAEFLVET
jgi:hypothetical protein